MRLLQKLLGLAACVSAAACPAQTTVDAVTFDERPDPPVREPAGGAIVVADETAYDDLEFVDLFDGETLDGWRNPYDRGEANVEDGVICLKADKKFFLVTERGDYADFVFEAEIMLPPTGKANSGLMFRANVEPNRVYGYQAECDPTPRGWTGGLHDEDRRRWLFPKKGEEQKVTLLQAPQGEWIKYRIVCRGDSLKIFVNDDLKTAYVDDVDAAGHFGLQHHGEKGQVYRFRNIRVAELAE